MERGAGASTRSYPSGFNGAAWAAPAVLDGYLHSRTGRDSSCRETQQWKLGAGGCSATLGLWRQR